jgi:FkbM family methyltransferase
VYALEPDAANVKKLQASVAGFPQDIQPKVTVWPYAVGAEDEEIRFLETHDFSSKVSTSSEGTAIQSRKLDSLPWEQKPTYVKMDIEGWEPPALAGATQLLKSEMPVLAICLYHRSEHLWQIPNLIHSIAPGYSFHVRRYAEDTWELVCYAVPPKRKLSK